MMHGSFNGLPVHVQYMSTASPRSEGTEGCACSAMYSTCTRIGLHRQVAKVSVIRSGPSAVI